MIKRQRQRGSSILPKMLKHSTTFSLKQQDFGRLKNLAQSESAPARFTRIGWRQIWRNLAQQSGKAKEVQCQSYVIMVSHLLQLATRNPSFFFLPRRLLPSALHLSIFDMQDSLLPLFPSNWGSELYGGNNLVDQRQGGTDPWVFNLAGLNHFP